MGFLTLKKGKYCLDKEVTNKVYIESLYVLIKIYEIFHSLKKNRGKKEKLFFHSWPLGKI